VIALGMMIAARIAGESMSMIIHAVFQDGVFKPKGPVLLPEGTEVIVEPNDPDGEPSALELAVRRITSRTPTAVIADRERVLALTPPPRALPPGKTLADVVVGQWPGDETDEQVRQALENLS
jgi:predicted DNA-binding antitoxin AbrB/MazE fold protein